MYIWNNLSLLAIFLYFVPSPCTSLLLTLQPNPLVPSRTISTVTPSGTSLDPLVNVPVVLLLSKSVVLVVVGTPFSHGLTNPCTPPVSPHSFSCLSITYQRASSFLPSSILDRNLRNCLWFKEIRRHFVTRNSCVRRLSILLSYSEIVSQTVCIQSFGQSRDHRRNTNVDWYPFRQGRVGPRGTPDFANRYGRDKGLLLRLGTFVDLRNT